MPLDISTARENTVFAAVISSALAAVEPTITPSTSNRRIAAPSLVRPLSSPWAPASVRE
ncbi:hypothetical protein D3C78_354040 [compost metagenome]